LLGIMLGFTISLLGLFFFAEYSVSNLDTFANYILFGIPIVFGIMGLIRPDWFLWLGKYTHSL